MLFPRDISSQAVEDAHPLLQSSREVCKGSVPPNTNTGPECRTQGFPAAWECRDLTWRLAGIQGMRDLHQIMEMIRRRASLYSPFPKCCLVDLLQGMLKIPYCPSPELHRRVYWYSFFEPYHPGLQENVALQIQDILQLLELAVYFQQQRYFLSLMETNHHLFL